MNALLSGLAGQGLLLDDDKHYLISIDAPEEIKPATEMGFFPFSNDRDTLTFLENVTPEEALQELQLLYRQQEALDLALMLFDDDLSVELRREAATELDELLNNEAVQAYLKAILYAKPLPPSADKTGALKTAEEAKAVLVLPFLKMLIERQKQIALVRRSWDTLPMDLFKAEALQSKVHAIAIENQLFPKLVESLMLDQLDGLDHRFGQHSPWYRYQLWQAGSPVDHYGPNDDHGQLDQFERDALDALKSVENHERIVDCWVGNLREEPKIDGLDHRSGQHPSLHRYQPWQAGSPVDCYGPNDDRGQIDAAEISKIQAKMIARVVAVVFKATKLVSVAKSTLPRFQKYKRK